MPIPLLGTALAAIASMLAKRGLDLLSGVFRGPVDKETEEVAALVEEQTGIDISDVAEDRLSEAQWDQLKAFEFEYQEKLLEYRKQADASELAREQALHQDRAGARSMQLEAIKSNDPFVRRFTYYYAMVVTLATFAFIGWAAFGHDYTNASYGSGKVIDTVLGFLLGVSLSAIIQYFYGSSSGSKAKGEDIKEVLQSLSGQPGKGGRQP